MKNFTTNTIILLIASSIIFFLLGRFSVSTENSNSLNPDSPSKEILSIKGDEEKVDLRPEVTAQEEEVASVEAPDTLSLIHI